MNTLKKRVDFVRIAKEGEKWVSPGLIIQAKRRPLLLSDVKETARFGFTASKKVGNAIARNKAKRRLRVLVRQVQDEVDQHLDFVLIARHSTVDYDFAKLTSETKRAFRKLSELIERKGRTK
jgi:ribonuclease P protein component